MDIPTTGESFVYTQYAETDADGNFEMTLPYSTTGYDEFGPEEGYTNPSVRANGSYQFLAPEAGAIGQTDVTEAQVIGEDETPVTVELVSIESQLTTSAESEPDGDSETSDQTAGDDTTQSSRIAPVS